MFHTNDRVIRLQRSIFIHYSKKKTFAQLKRNICSLRWSGQKERLRTSDWFAFVMRSSCTLYVQPVGLGRRFCPYPLRIRICNIFKFNNKSQNLKNMWYFFSICIVCTYANRLTYFILSAYFLTRWIWCCTYFVAGWVWLWWWESCLVLRLWRKQLHRNVSLQRTKSKAATWQRRFLL